MRERPELTEWFSAIDGIKKKERNFRRTDCNTSGQDYTRFDPSEDAIRADVLELLKSPGFDDWYGKRKDALMEEIQKYELIGSIPYLSYPNDPYTMTANTQLKNHIEILKQANEYLTLLGERRQEIKGLL